MNFYSCSAEAFIAQRPQLIGCFLAAGLGRQSLKVVQ